jgi:hypothetical protein
MLELMEDISNECIFSVCIRVLLINLKFDVRGSTTRVPAICFFFLAGTIFFEASPNRNKNRQMSKKERDNF